MHFSHSPTYGLCVRLKDVPNKAKGPTPSQDLQENEGLSSGKQCPLMAPRARATPTPDSGGLVGSTSDQTSGYYAWQTMHTLHHTSLMLQMSLQQGLLFPGNSGHSLKIRGQPTVGR